LAVPTDDNDDDNSRNADYVSEHRVLSRIQYHKNSTPSGIQIPTTGGKAYYRSPTSYCIRHFVCHHSIEKVVVVKKEEEIEADDYSVRAIASNSLKSIIITSDSTNHKKGGDIDIKNYQRIDPKMRLEISSGLSRSAPPEELTTLGVKDIYKCLLQLFYEKVVVKEILVMPLKEKKK
jgi:hypothetical protein